MELQPGDLITAVTAQGASTYKVAGFGDSARPVRNPNHNQLLLETAAGPFFASGYEQVTAVLVGPPKENPGARPAPSPQEAALAGDTGRVLPLILWTEGLLAAAVGTVLLLRRKWRPAPVLLCAVPAGLALVWAVYENLALLLPNLY